MCPYTSIHNPLRTMCQPPFTTWAPGWFRVIEGPRILKKTPSEATNFMFGCAGLMHLPSTPLDDLSKNMGILTEEIQSLLYDCTLDQKYLFICREKKQKPFWVYLLSPSKDRLRLLKQNLGKSGIWAPPTQRRQRHPPQLASSPCAPWPRRIELVSLGFSWPY